MAIDIYLFNIAFKIWIKLLIFFILLSHLPCLCLFFSPPTSTADLASSTPNQWPLLKKAQPLHAKSVASQKKISLFHAKSVATTSHCWAKPSPSVAVEPCCRRRSLLSHAVDRPCRRLPRHCLVRKHFGVFPNLLCYFFLKIISI